MRMKQDAILCEYNDFLRAKRAIMEKIGNALEGVTAELVYNSADMTDGDRKELERLQDRLEAIYEGLEAVVN